MDFVLLDFWLWAASDLVGNTNRGRLAEFIVARAVGLGRGDVRSEWDVVDVLTPTGTKVEVKSAAYVQSWFQNKLSNIQFVVTCTNQAQMLGGRWVVMLTRLLRNGLQQLNKLAGQRFVACKDITKGLAWISQPSRNFLFSDVMVREIL